MPVLQNVVIYAEANDAARTFRPAAQTSMSPITIYEESERRGRYGAFYRATFRNQPCAIKVIKGNCFNSDEAVQAYFTQERDALVGQHTNPLFPALIATGMLHLGDNEECPCIVMQLVEGKTIAEAREDIRSLGIFGAVKTACLPLADGLERLEERGFAHCDISPSNVIMKGDGTLNLVDCGCLTPLSLPPRGEGTSPYVLPEWAGRLHEKPDCKGIDAYALASLSRELLSLERDEKPSEELARKLAEEMEPKLSCYGAASVEELTQAMASFAKEINHAFVEELDRQIVQIGRGKIEEDKLVSSIHARFASFCDSWCDSLKMAVCAWRLIFDIPMQSIIARASRVSEPCPAIVSYVMSQELMPSKLSWLFSSKWNRKERPTEAEVYLEYGFLLLADADEEGAQKEFEKAAEKGNVAAVIALGRIAERHDPKHAEELYERAIESGDDDIRAIAINCLALLVGRHNPTRAVKLYEQAIELNSDAAAYNLASHYHDKKPEQAIRLYELAYELAAASGNPRIARAAMNNLALLVENQHPDRAVALLLHVMMLNQTDDISGAAAHNLAHLAQQGRPDLAEKLYKMAIEHGDSRTVGYAKTELAFLTLTQNPKKAEELFEQAAKLGNPAAMNGLALLIWGRNPARAESLLRQAIELDLNAAVCNLAHLVYDSNPTEAKELYERALKEGDTKVRSKALCALTLLFQERDPNKTAEAIEQLAESGNVYAIRHLASFLKEENPEIAIGLYLKAIERGDDEVRAEAANSLACLIADNDPKQAEDLYEWAIKMGSIAIKAAAAFSLANLVAHHNPKRAKNLYEFAMETGSVEIRAEAASNLATLLKSQDPEKAESLYEWATKLGSATAMANLAFLIQNRDPNRAEILNERAIDLGSSTAMNNLACLIKETKPDEMGKAIKLFEQAIELGEPAAMFHLGELLEEGIENTLEKDVGRAIQLHKQALELGENRSQEALKRLGAQ